MGMSCGMRHDTEVPSVEALPCCVRVGVGVGVRVRVRVRVRVTWVREAAVEIWAI